MPAAVRLVVWVGAMALAVATAASASDTGTVSGAVSDDGRKSVGDAAFTISGDRLPLGRATLIGANGLHRFDDLLPGEYVVEVEKASVGRSGRTTLVAGLKDTL